MKSLRTNVLGVALAALAFMLAAAPVVRADTYDVDPVHSFTLFSVHHFNAGYVWGRFDKSSGTFALDDADPTKDSFDITVEADSLNTGNTMRDNHVKGPDFLNAKQYPTITFKSTSVKKTGDDTLEVVGDLTLRDVTKSITVTITKTGTGQGMKGETRSGFETRFSINRNDYHVSSLPGAVGDEIRLIIAVEGIKQQ